MKPKRHIDPQYEMHRTVGMMYPFIRTVGILLDNKAIWLLKSDEVRQFAMRQIKASTLPKEEHVERPLSKEQT